LLGGASDGGGDRRSNTAVEDARDDVVGREVVGVDNLGESVRRRKLHLACDPARANVERAAENAGEGEHVVDLVRERVGELLG
jgi:hypothetical protein